MADFDVRSLPISQVSSLDPALAERGTLMLVPGPTPTAYLKVEFQDQPGILPLVQITDRPFTIIPIAPGLGPFLAIQDAELVVDLNRTHTAASGEIRAGQAFVAGSDAGLVAKFGYGTSYVTIDGLIFQNTEWAVTSFFEAWRYVVNVGGQPMTIVDSRLGMRV